MPVKPLVPTLLSGIIILLLLYASLSKFNDFQRFVNDINNQPLPKSFTPFLSRAIPVSEIVICILLWFDRTRRLGFGATLVFMSIFTGYAVLILVHGFDYIPCSCGGVIEKLSWPQHLVLNVAFATLSGIGLRLQRRHWWSGPFSKN